MARIKKRTRRQAKTGANVGYESELWKMADTLRGNMDAAEYKHVVLGLIFLKYISDAFEEWSSSAPTSPAMATVDRFQRGPRPISRFTSKNRTTRLGGSPG